MPTTQRPRVIFRNGSDIAKKEVQHPPELPDNLQALCHMFDVWYEYEWNHATSRAWRLTNKHWLMPVTIASEQEEDWLRLIQEQYKLHGG